MQITQNTISSPFDAWFRHLNSLRFDNDKTFYQNVRQAFLEAQRFDISQPEAFFVVANMMEQAGGAVVWPKLHDLWFSARCEWKALRNGHGIKTATAIPPIVKGHDSQQPINGIGTVTSPPRAMATKTVIIDGTNVIYGSHSNPQPSLMNVLGLLIELNRLAFVFKCYFDATTYSKLLEAGKKSEAYAYRRFCYDYPDIFIEVPGGNKADDFLLQYANTQRAAIITNDLFRDYSEKYQWLKTEPKRRASFVVHSKMIQIVSLGFSAAIPDDLAVAEEALKAALEKPALVKAHINITGTSNHAYGRNEAAKV